MASAPGVGPVPAGHHSGLMGDTAARDERAGRAAAPGRRESDTRRVCLERRCGGPGCGAGAPEAPARRRPGGAAARRRSRAPPRSRARPCPGACARCSARRCAPAARPAGPHQARASSAVSGSQRTGQCHAARPAAEPSRTCRQLWLLQQEPGSMPSQPLVANALSRSYVACAVVRCAGPGGPQAGRMPSSVSRKPAQPGQARRRAPRCAPAASGRPSRAASRHARCAARPAPPQRPPPRRARRCTPPSAQLPARGRPGCRQVGREAGFESEAQEDMRELPTRRPTKPGCCIPSLTCVVTQARRSCRLRAANRPQRAPCTSLFAADVPARGALRELCSVRTSSTAARAPSTRPTRLAAQGCARRGGRGPGGHVPVLPGGPDIQRAA